MRWNFGFRMRCSEGSLQGQKIKEDRKESKLQTG